MKKQYWILTLIFLALIIIWVAYIMIMTSAFSDWTTRGQFGDMFGSVNSLFSCLAFVGLVYTIILQKNEMKANVEFMEAQLREMKEDRNMQFQPIPIPMIEGIEIEKPRLFFPPYIKKCLYYSRYHLKYRLFNDSENVTLNAIFRATLIYNNSKEERKFEVSSHSFDYIKTKNETDEQSDLFTEDKNNVMLDAIREANVKKMPLLLVELMYKNIMGSCFQLNQVFVVDIKREDDELLKDWLIRIKSFSTEYKTEVEFINRKPISDSPESRELYEKIEMEISGKTTDGSIVLKCTEIPNTFKIKNITEEEYNECVSKSNFGTKIPALSKVCLSEH